MLHGTVLIFIYYWKFIVTIKITTKGNFPENNSDTIQIFSQLFYKYYDEELSDKS